MSEMDSLDFSMSSSKDITKEIADAIKKMEVQEKKYSAAPTARSTAF